MLKIEEEKVTAATSLACDLEDAYQEINRLRAQVDASNLLANNYEAENNNLRSQLEEARRKRDHYARQSNAYKHSLIHIGSVITETVAANMQGTRPTQPKAEEPMPRAVMFNR